MRASWLILGAVLGAAPPVLAQEGEASGPLVVNGGLMIWTLVVFVLLFLVLKRFAWPAARSPPSVSGPWSSYGERPWIYRWRPHRS
jgi:hypothetical protein